jgi:hypothetical protein
MEPQPDALEDDSKEQESPVEADTNFSDGRLLAYAQIGNRKILANLIEWGLAYQSAIMPTETASKIDEDGTLIPPRPKTEEEVDSAKAVCRVPRNNVIANFVPAFHDECIPLTTRTPRNKSRSSHFWQSFWKKRSPLTCRDFPSVSVTR